MKKKIVIIITLLVLAGACFGLGLYLQHIWDGVGMMAAQAGG